MINHRFEAVRRRLVSDSAPELLIESFQRQFQHLCRGQTGLVSRSDLADIGPLPDLSALKDDGHGLAAKAVVIKLNGGLGTSMGLERAKSLLPVKNGMSFLEIIARQILHLRRVHRIPLPLLLMNSFSTEDDSLEELRKLPELSSQPIPLSFLQNRVPKLRADDYSPVEWPADPEKQWCPPGHGDLYIALKTSGALDRLLDGGFEYAFVSNADNLGATLDLRILAEMDRKKIPFLMEVTDRTEADKKGGHLARRKDGTLLLREIAMCPESELEDFQDIGRHPYFNTNNLWMNLRALADRREIDLPIIINKKTVDPRDPSSTPVIQLETAMGSAIGVFENAAALRVPRIRFAPVKTTDDLLALWSDAYELTPEWHVKLDARRARPPVIRLDSRHYRLIDDFQKRFECGAPSLIACDSLSVKGDIQFGPGVVIQGAVALDASATRRVANEKRSG